MPRASKSPPRDAADTAGRLLDAAERQFNSVGFLGTDTNRIAREAGYAPQTFYRHFGDKTEIFLAVYERWWRSEFEVLGKILRGPAPVDVEKFADTLIAFHLRWRSFRRALRHLATEDDRIRKARVEARRSQVETALALLPHSKLGHAQIYVALLVFERLCDAVAEGEFADMGFSKSAARQAVIDAARTLL